MDNNGKGAGWIKTSKNGLKYILCKMNINGIDYNFSIFKNTKKQLEKHPDYNIVLSEYKKQNAGNVSDVFCQNDPFQENNEDIQF